MYAGFLQVVLREVPQHAELVPQRHVGERVAVVVLRHAHEAGLVGRVLDHVAGAEDHELDPGLFAQLARVRVELLVAGHEQRDHAELGLLEPRLDVLAHVAALRRDVRRADDVLDAELAAHARLIAAREIGDHAPVVRERDRVHPEHVS